MIELQSITFNHSPNGSATSALNVRVNSATPVSIPEYIHGPTPVSLGVAYAIDAAAASSTFVRARFARSAGTTASSYEVRAGGGGVLGSLDPFQVVFTNDPEFVEVDLPLAHRTFSAVGRHDVLWSWSYRSGRQWRLLARSRHRIYLLLSVPAAPWTQVPNASKNTWTDLLDFSCALAAGQTTSANALRALTIAIHSNFALKYDVTGANQKYGIGDTRIAAQAKFHLTEWIEWVLKAGILNAAPGASQNRVCPGNPHEYFEYLSPACFDCAAALTLMARSIGIAADYVFHPTFGYLNYVWLIGRGKANNPFYNSACIAQPPEVGPDAHRAVVAIHAYVRLGDRIYDATYREWMSLWQSIVLSANDWMTSLFPIKRRTPRYLSGHSPGWLIDASQTEYERRVIDRNAPFETDPNITGGTPIVQALDIHT